LAALPLILAGCPPKKKPVTMIEPVVQEAPVEMSDAPSLEVGSDWAAAPVALETVTFDTNRSDLTAEARARLKRNAAVLKVVFTEAKSVSVRVEGHCDERNTLEYNLALGERRANTVRDYYFSLGLPKSAVSSVSYGEERPVCSESSEGCWLRNRRGETTLKSSSGPVRIPLSKLPVKP
jgi:peptidoglycan-associated lipoprotein